MTEREKFEAWYIDKYWNFKQGGNDFAPFDAATNSYSHLDVNLAWNAYQAAAAEPAKPEEPFDELRMLEAVDYDETHGITYTLRRDRIEELRKQLNIVEPTAAPSPAVAEPARKAIDAQGAEVPRVFLQNLHYFCAQIDGTYKWPAGMIGDLLKQAKREIEASPLPAATLGKAEQVNPIGYVSSLGLKRLQSDKYAVATIFTSGAEETDIALFAQQPAASDVRDAERLDWAIRDVFDGADKLVSALHDDDGFPIRFEDARGAIDIALQSTPDVHAGKGES